MLEHRVLHAIPLHRRTNWLPGEFRNRNLALHLACDCTGNQDLVTESQMSKGRQYFVTGSKVSKAYLIKIWQHN